MSTRHFILDLTRFVAVATIGTETFRETRGLLNEVLGSRTGDISCETRAITRTELASILYTDYNMAPSSRA